MKLFPVPEGAIDAHVHLFDPARFPFSADTPYRPPPSECGNESDLRAALDAHGLSGALLVNPSSGYGDDNACMLAALGSGEGKFRGIARVPFGTSKSRLKALASCGVVGVRRDLVGEGAAQLDEPGLARLATAMADLDLVLQLHFQADQAIAVAQAVHRLPCRIAIDHCGRPDTAAGLRAPAFRRLLSLARLPRVAVKLSGGFRFGRHAPQYDDTDPLALALLAAFGPERCLWGSDWPFVRMPHRIDYGTSLALLGRWIPDPGVRRQILVDTPRQWLGFGSVPG